MSISAAMVKSLIQCSALEGAYHNIRVNGVAAGVTNTRARMNEDIRPEVPKLTLQEKIQKNIYTVKKLGQDVPLGAVPNTPSDVADSILFLGSNDASFTTGEILVVDGGQSLTNDRFDDFTLELRKQDY
jgi:NAD(P)-dependent dehydrogenase (short-subunit alcohol dehydrogenase family)